MRTFVQSISIILILFSAEFCYSQTINEPQMAFKVNPVWITSNSVSAIGYKLQIDEKLPNKTIMVTKGGKTQNEHLISNAYLGDKILHMDYLLAEGGTAKIYLIGRYAVELHSKNNEWQTLSLKFRSPRFDEAHNKLQSALLIEMKINGEVVDKNKIMESISNGATMNWEDEHGPATILANHGPFAFKNFMINPADFSKVTLPNSDSGSTNQETLVDFVILGKETFESVGCNVCHSTTLGATVNSTGPNLFGLFKPSPRKRDVVEGGEGHRFSIKADMNYLHRSIRAPADQLAITEHGNKKGEAYPAIMPAFSSQTLSDVQIDAIGAYLLTLNLLHEQGPVIKLMPKAGGAKYEPLEDTLQLLVSDQVRIQRGPMAGVSGRAIHVGQPNSVNYTFDPRTLSIVKLWQGGFLDMSGEFLNRGGKGLNMGYESREIEMGKNEILFGPLNSKGKNIDFSFKEAKFGDVKTIQESLNSKQDPLDMIATVNAQFLGYDKDSTKKSDAPVFHYRIGKNTISVKTEIASTGDTIITLTGKLNDVQSFAFNAQVLHNVNVSHGEIKDNQWALPKGKLQATLKAKILLANNSWHANKSKFSYQMQPVKITPAQANLPAGYSIENYYPPKDNYGREQLFEALGLDVTHDGTIIVGTRTAGIWRIINGKWEFFAEGAFDSLGVIAGDTKGLTIIAGQKAELTRISDINGDGIADKYETLFDAHSYHGNYHSYMHGPVRGADGTYYFNINLADGNDGSTYKAGGAYMGSAGGFAGWAIQVKPNGEFKPWAYGLRSPAGLGVSPDGRLWYSENQGEFVGTSKIFLLKPDKFYGHPASLVDLPGKIPGSPEIAWDRVSDKRERPVILLPHNRVANSPGNLTWDTTKGKFGIFAGQILIGDQTQSNLLRASTEVIEGIEQGSVMPFIDGLESGVMRPIFLPDGSLLLGQTGRGWQAKGGHVASLQRILWDGKTVAPAIKNIMATSTGFSIELTKPVVNSVTPQQLIKLINVESWVYRDAPDYGSDELELHNEDIKECTLGEDKKIIHIALASLKQSQIHPQQTARVYHVTLHSNQIFNTMNTGDMNAYYTLYKFPSSH